MNVTGIILAGGKSSRMGTDKGLVDLNGNPMITYSINVLKNVVSKVIIIANQPGYKQFNLDVYPDLIPNKGPVGGIYTALSCSKTEQNIIVSCDTPFITKKLLNNLLLESKHYEVTIVKFKNKIHPLIGVYNQSVKSIFEENIHKNKLKLGLVNQQNKLKVVSYNDCDFDEKTFFNINTQTDLKQHKS